MRTLGADESLATLWTSSEVDELSIGTFASTINREQAVQQRRCESDTPALQPNSPRTNEATRWLTRASEAEQWSSSRWLSTVLRGRQQGIAKRAEGTMSLVTKKGTPDGVMSMRRH